MITNNPFNPSFGNRPSRIVGRDGLIRSVLDGLAGKRGGRERCTLVLGQRGMGKTALLLELSDRSLGLGFVPARVSAGPSMLDDIVDAVQFEGTKLLDKGGSRITGLSAGAFGFSVGLSFSQQADSYGFRTKMAMLCDRLEEAGKGVLILVDEVQPNSDQMRQLAGAYQLLVGDGKNIAIVMAGLPSAVSNILNDDVLTFLNRARREWLGALAISQVRAYYSATFAQVGMSISDDLVSKAAAGTRGFPYLLQLVGYYLVEYSGAGAVTDKTLLLADEAAREDLEQNVFEATLRPLSAGDLRFLRAMAPDGGLSTIANITARLGGDKNWVQPYRARLIDAGVVVSPRRGELEFTLPYLADYLAGDMDGLA